MEGWRVDSWMDERVVKRWIDGWVNGEMSRKVRVSTMLSLVIDAFVFMPFYSPNTALNSV